jgi:hypothetical protein
MSRDLSRRSLLTGAGYAAAGTLAALLPGELFAAQPAATTQRPAQGAAGAKTAPTPAAAPITNICLTMLYPSGPDLKFDADGFRDRHIPVLRKAYGAGVGRIEVRVPPPVVEGATPPPLLAAVSMWITDFAKFAAAANANAKDVAASIATITNSRPMAQFDSVVAGVGGDRAGVIADSRCLSYIFEAKQDATWDAKSYAETYVPRFVAACGPEAIRRVEVVKGEAGADGNKPLLLGMVNFYIADPEKLVAAMATESVKLVTAEEEKYFSVKPIQTWFMVHSVG